MSKPTARFRLKSHSTGIRNVNPLSKPRGQPRQVENQDPKTAYSNMTRWSKFTATWAAGKKATGEKRQEKEETWGDNQRNQIMKWTYPSCRRWRGTTRAGGACFVSCTSFLFFLRAFVLLTALHWMEISRDNHGESTGWPVPSPVDTSSFFPACPGTFFINGK